MRRNLNKNKNMVVAIIVTAILVISLITRLVNEHRANRAKPINEESFVRMLDQTTPNMIQRISGIFERNPLISKEI